MELTRDKLKAELQRYKNLSGENYHTSESAESRLFLLCSLADDLKEKNGYGEVNVCVDPEIKHGVITYDTDDLIIEKGDDCSFFKKLQLSDFVSFSKLPNEDMRVSFGVKDLWN